MDNSNNTSRPFFTGRKFLALVLGAALATAAVAVWAEITQPDIFGTVKNENTDEITAEASAVQESETVQPEADAPEAETPEADATVPENQPSLYDTEKLEVDSLRLPEANTSCDSDGNIITSVPYGGDGAVLLPESSDDTPLLFISPELKTSTDITSVELSGSIIAILSDEGHVADTRGAFYGHPRLAKFLPSEGLCYIGNKAFYECKALEKIFLPESLTYIGDRAFYDCNSLERISVHGNTAIGDGAFAECDSLSEIYLSDKVIRVGIGAFEHTPFFDGLTDEFCVVGDVLVKYNGNASDVVIPEGVRVIADGVFAGKYNIKTVKLPSCVSYVGGSAFRGCFRLESVVFDKDNPPTVGENAFDGCPFLETEEVSALAVNGRSLLVTASDVSGLFVN